MRHNENVRAIAPLERQGVRDIDFAEIDGVSCVMGKNGELTFFATAENRDTLRDSETVMRFTRLHQRVLAVKGLFVVVTEPVNYDDAIETLCATARVAVLPTPC